MFKCVITGKLSKPGHKLNKVVVATRTKIYKEMVRNEETRKWEELEVGKGFEIVKEIDATDEGVALWESWSAEDRTAFLQNLS